MSSEAPMRAWLCAPMSQEVKAAIERLRRAEDVQRIAIMPDVHLASGVCIGTVVATSRLIFPPAIGSDIGCGMAAAAFDCDAAVLDNAKAATAVLGKLREAVPILRQRSLGYCAALPERLGELSSSALRAAAAREGRIERGTLGRGNHFLEFQRDQDSRLWLMVHSGSRVMGQEITRAHVARASRVGSGLVALDASSDAGRAYWNDVEWAVRYAELSRAAMVEAAADVVRRVIGARMDEGSRVDASHNHVRVEKLGEVEVLVHRKGASPARDGEPGMIPGSMGTASFHVAGRGVEEALWSSSHGAGRAVSRGAAGRRVSEERLTREIGDVWMDRTRLRGLVDEAPSAYKDVRAVMRAQRELVRITRELSPVLSYKGV